MKLAEKIFQERKKLGLSQEQFAERMEISRQAVSKWESGQSMPDLDKLVMMSRIFGVSTDYLLKEDEVCYNESDTEPSHGEATYKNGASDEHEASMNDYKSSETAPDMHIIPARELSMEEVDNYQKVSFASAKKIARGVFLCILGLILCSGTEMLILELLPLENAERFENLSALPLLICVATAIAHFVPAGMKLSMVEHYQKERFVLPDSVEQRLREESDDFQSKFTTAITVGVVLIIVGLVAGALFEAMSSITGSIIWEEYVGGMTLLFLIAAAVYVFITHGMKRDFYHIILQEEDYAVNRKNGMGDAGQQDSKDKSGDLIGMVATVYWCLVTAGYLGYSFLTRDWGRSWIVWPVAGCIFGAIAAFLAMYGEMKKTNE